MCVCVCTHTHTHTRTYMYIYNICIYIYIYIYIYTYDIYIYIYIYTYIYIYIYIYIYVCVYVCVQCVWGCTYVRAVVCVCGHVYASWSGTVFIQASFWCIQKVSIQNVLRLVYIQVLWEFCYDQIGKIHDLIFFLICVIVLVPLTAPHFLSHHESIQLILL